MSAKKKKSADSRKISRDTLKIKMWDTFWARWYFEMSRIKRDKMAQAIRCYQNLQGDHVCRSGTKVQEESKRRRKEGSAVWELVSSYFLDGTPSICDCTHTQCTLLYGTAMWNTVTQFITKCQSLPQQARSYRLLALCECAPGTYGMCKSWIWLDLMVQKCHFLLKWCWMCGWNLNLGEFTEALWHLNDTEMSVWHLTYVQFIMGTQTRPQSFLPWYDSSSLN